MNNCKEVIVPALEDTISSFSIESEENYCRVTTPFQQPNGDLVSVWVTKGQGEKFAVRDRGETFAMLRLYGVNPESESRLETLDLISHQFDVKVTGGEIETVAMRENLGKAVLNTIQASQAVSRLIYTHRSGSSTQFKTQVDSFLDDSGYSYQDGFSVQGETATVEFDFSINHREPKVLLDTVHSRSDQYLKQQVNNVMLHWHEIQEKPYQHGVVIDDVDADPDAGTVSRLVDNLDYYFVWSGRNKILDEIPVTA